MNLGVTNHAVERYVERVKPCSGFAAAKAELLALLSMEPKITPTPPEWMTEAHHETEAFVEVADGIVGAVKGDSVTTILTRGGTHPDKAKRKKERKAKRKAEKRQHSRASKPPKQLRGEGAWAERSKSWA